MGALHAGHLALMRRARAECGTVAVSIFVNPLQFGPSEDFDRYPRQLEKDCQLLEQEAVDLLFLPSADEMYPPGATTFVDVGALGERLDGASRPGHFRGVATVVAKLLNIVQPQRAYFGQKDAVQLAVLRRMIADLNLPVDLVACPIVRDPDGLALSSRHAYLSAKERQAALSLSAAINAVAASDRALAEALALGKAIVAGQSLLTLEYLEAVDPTTLFAVPELQPGTLIAIAAQAGKTRLIDNLLLPGTLSP